MIQFDRLGVPHADSEIVHPPPDIGLDMTVPVRHGDAPTAAREPAHPALESHDSLYRSSHLPSLKRKAKEGTVQHADHLALVRVHLYLEFLKVSGDAGHHALSCTLRLHEYDTIIGIAGESALPPLKFFIEIIEEDVTQKR